MRWAVPTLHNRYLKEVDKIYSFRMLKLKTSIYEYSVVPKGLYSPYIVIIGRVGFFRIYYPLGGQF